MALAALARGGGAWQNTAMPKSSPSSRPMAGGVLITLGVIGGATAGFILRQPTIGFLIGAGTGIVLALAIWALDRR